MEVLYERCCGLDVHKKSITACILTANGKKREKVLRRFGTMTTELLELAVWLKRFSVTHVAITRIVCATATSALFLPRSTYHELGADFL